MASGNDIKTATETYNGFVKVTAWSHETVSPNDYRYCGGYLTAGMLTHQEPSTCDMIQVGCKNPKGTPEFAYREFPNRLPIFAMNRSEP